MQADLHQAYDLVHLPTLWDILKTYHLPTKISQSIIALYQNRQITLPPRFNNITSRITYSGLSQGTALSPTLFTLYISKLNQTPLLHSSLSCYADDIILHARLPRLSKSQYKKQIQLITEDIQHLVIAIHNIHLVINYEKTYSIIFSPGRKHQNTTIHIEKNIITSVHSIKFLGLTYTHNLQWTKHIQTIIQKIKNRTLIFRHIAGTNWGAHPQSLLILFKGFIIPIIQYGITVMHPPIQQSQKQLQSLTYQIIKIILGIPGKPSTTQILKYVHICNWHQLQNIQSIRFLAKLHENTNAPLYRQIIQGYQKWNNPVIPNKFICKNKLPTPSFYNNSHIFQIIHN